MSGARMSACVALLALAACVGDAPPSGPTLRLWHTFGPEETRALNQALAQLARTRGVRVEPKVVPFGLARSRFAHALGAARATDCPDVARVDATWLPQLAQAGRLLPVPDGFGLDAFTPE